MSDDSKDDNQSDLISKTEAMYFSLERNISQEAKNIYAQFMSLVRDQYDSSTSKQEWNQLLAQMQDAINNFENKLSDEAEMQFYGIYHNALDLTTKSHRSQ